ncbi:hypothetical protein [Marinomonas algicola]|uniref:hypothetical protein n=1 Tax=Marinomonas algicola TaxID=2773454 RepID=UPI00174E48FE|nr:hypothetical protein [Marinomonas algicola]
MSEHTQAKGKRTKRILVKNLLVGELKSVIQSAIDRNVINADGSMSLGLLDVLKLSIKECKKLEHDQSLTLSDIRRIAKENEVVNNLSQSSAIKIRDMIYVAHVVASRGPDVDVVEYAIQTRIAARIAKPGALEDTETLFEKIKAFNNLVVFPLLITKALAEKTGSTRTLPPLACRFNKVSLATAEALVTLLEDPENEFNASNIQQIIKKKNQKTMSYNMIKDILQTVAWVELNVVSLDCLELCNTNTLVLLKNTLAHVVENCSKDQAIKAISTILYGYYSAIALNSKHSTTGMVMFD